MRRETKHIQSSKTKVTVKFLKNAMKHNITHIKNLYYQFEVRNEARKISRKENKQLEMMSFEKRRR